jgi:hypothetical protein
MLAICRFQAIASKLNLLKIGVTQSSSKSAGGGIRQVSLSAFILRAFVNTG